MRISKLSFLVVIAACDDEPSITAALDVGNPGNCANFQSPRDVGSLATLSSASTAGFTVVPAGADKVKITIPADGYGREAITHTLTKCDEHFHNPIEHTGACEEFVCGGDGCPAPEQPTLIERELAHAASDEHGPAPGMGDVIELHTAYSSAPDNNETGLKRCKGVAFVRGSHWIVSADQESSPLFLDEVVRYAGSLTGGGGQPCKGPVWWEVARACHVMSINDPRLAGNAHPARPLQTYLSPMKRLIML
jgi:hypothetical protein